jgi:hypothetical protein
MRKVAFQIGLALAAIALTLPMMAKAPKADKAGEAKAKNATLTIDTPVQFGSTMVNPGSYKLVIDNEKATIQNGNKVVASVPGHWEDRKQKADSTGFETTNGKVDDIFVHGDSSVFVLSPNQSAGK